MQRPTKNKQTNKQTKKQLCKTEDGSNITSILKVGHIEYTNLTTIIKTLDHVGKWVEGRSDETGVIYYFNRYKTCKHCKLITQF